MPHTDYDPESCAPPVTQREIERIVDPLEIERKSMRIIDEEAPEPRPFEGEEWTVVRRMIHTSADFEMLQKVKFHPDALETGKRALASGCEIFTDTMMANVGISKWRMQPLGCRVVTMVHDERAVERASRENISRSIAAVDLAAENPGIRVFVIGNAPTALLRLLELAELGLVSPALIVGMPVGFVNAAESKALLAKQSPAPYVTIEGRKGGSALAASVINALARLGESEKLGESK